MKQRNSMKEHKNHHRCPHLGKNVSLRPTVLIYPSSYHLSTYRKQTKINFGRILLKQWNRNIVTPWMVTLIVSWALVISKVQWYSSAGNLNFMRYPSQNLENYFSKISCKSPWDQWIKIKYYFVNGSSSMRFCHKSDHTSCLLHEHSLFLLSKVHEIGHCAIKNPCYCY